MTSKTISPSFIARRVNIGEIKNARSDLRALAALYLLYDSRHSRRYPVYIGQTADAYRRLRQHRRHRRGWDFAADSKTKSCPRWFTHPPTPVNGSTTSSPLSRRSSPPGRQAIPPKLRRAIRPTNRKRAARGAGRERLVSRPPAAIPPKLRSALALAKPPVPSRSKSRLKRPPPLSIAH